MVSRTDINLQPAIAPFTWREALDQFEVGDIKKFKTSGAKMVARVRGNITRHQQDRNTGFATQVVAENGVEYFYIERLK